MGDCARERPEQRGAALTARDGVLAKQRTGELSHVSRGAEKVPGQRQHVLCSHRGTRRPGLLDHVVEDRVLEPSELDQHGGEGMALRSPQPHQARELTAETRSGGGVRAVGERGGEGADQVRSRRLADLVGARLHGLRHRIGERGYGGLRHRVRHG